MSTMASTTYGQQQDSNDIYKKLVEELLKNQSVVNLAASLNSDSVSQRRGKAIIGRNGQDSSAPISESTPVTSPTISLDTLIQSLAAQVRPEPHLSESSIDSGCSSSTMSTMIAKPTLDRSQSINIPQTANGVIGFKGMNMDRYKTELCRQFQETGFCKYGAKCQFAHGNPEVRGVSRHPKYKSEMCRTYHTTGLCPYGTRCHFIHDEEEMKMHETNRRQKAVLSQMARHSSVQRHSSLPIGSSRFDSRMFNPAVGSLDVSMSLGSVGDTPPSSISSSPAPSPTAFLYEDRTHSLPTPSSDSAFIAPPPGFSAPVGVPMSRSRPTVFNFPEVTSSTSPLSVQMLAMDNPLAAGLQAAIPSHDQGLVKDCFSDFYYMSPSPPMGADTEGDLCESPMDISRNLRLPIFGQLSSSLE